MQIRLTVLGPRGGHARAAAVRACDVLVTAPAGTPLAAVAGGLADAAAAAGADFAAGSGSGSVALYAGHERLDPQRCVVGEPPLVDGAVLSLQIPAEGGHPEAAREAASDAAARLHVVAGPDAGGVHLLRGGQVRIGRSAEADVPLDDPDVSRLHCALTVADDGRVTVADLGSTNGTTVDGEPVGALPTRLRPGALLHIGESALCLETGPAPGAGILPAVPDGEGHLRVRAAAPPAPLHAQAPPVPGHGEGAGPGAAGGEGRGAGPGTFGTGRQRPVGSRGPGTGNASMVPVLKARPRETPLRGARVSPGAGRGAPGCEGEEPAAPSAAARPSAQEDPSAQDGKRRGRGIGAWARRLAGWPDDRPAAEQDDDPATAHAAAGTAATAAVYTRWPDPATVLLTALGPTPRLWERGVGHPDSLVVRLGTADRAAGADQGVLPSAPVTVSLRQVGSLGLAGPRERLAGLARSVVAQLTALHSPATLELVLVSTDRARSAQERMAEWSWLGWLPHLHPARGQDCRLLLAYDREQAMARITELTQRLDDMPYAPGPASPGAGGAGGQRCSTAGSAPGRAPAQRYDGPYTVVIVDGDPGSAALREATTRLAVAGPAVGVHLICLAEAPAASPASPLSVTFEAACAASPAFAECGAVAMLTGDVATVLRLMYRGAAGRPDAPVSPPSPPSPESALHSGFPGPSGSPAFLLPLPYPGGAGSAAADTEPYTPGPGARSGVARPPVPPGGARPEAAPEALSAAALCDQVPAALGAAAPGSEAVPGAPPGAGAPGGIPGGPADVSRVPGNGAMATVGAVSEAWAERFARALAPLRTADTGAGTRRLPQVATALPRAARLLDELGLARVTPASLAARWAAGADGGQDPGGRIHAVLGASPHGPLAVDLAEGPHVLVEGQPGAGKTELLRSLAASLAATDRPDRVSLVLVDGGGTGAAALFCSPAPEARAEPGPGRNEERNERGGTAGEDAHPAKHRAGGAGQAALHRSREPSPGDRTRAGEEYGSRLRICTDLPHASTYLAASDPVRMREFAQALSSELKRRAELLGDLDFATWHAQRARTPRLVAPRRFADSVQTGYQGDLEPSPSGALKLRARNSSSPSEGAGATGDTAAGAPLPRLVVLVDDFDTLVAPALGSPGRPAAGSVVRALEAVAREGARLGVHLVVATGRPDRTAQTAAAHEAGLRIVLEAPSARAGAAGADDVPVGRGLLLGGDGTRVPFQAGRVSGRIPRTATLRPTVMPIDWGRMGDPPTRRPVRELGNGPTDLALLASALQRAAQEAGAEAAPPLV